MVVSPDAVSLSCCIGPTSGARSVSLAFPAGCPVAPLAWYALVALVRPFAGAWAPSSKASSTDCTLVVAARGAGVGCFGRPLSGVDRRRKVPPPPVHGAPAPQRLLARPWRTGCCARPTRSPRWRSDLQEGPPMMLSRPYHSAPARSGMAMRPAACGRSSQSTPQTVWASQCASGTQRSLWIKY